MRLLYDIVPHHGGWAINIAPSRPASFAGTSDSFPTKKLAFDVAVDLARRLRDIGLSVQIRVDHHAEEDVVLCKAS